MPGKYSLIIPVYRNEASVPELLTALTRLDEQLESALEVVFVVDGSPDRCAELLESQLPDAPFDSQLLLLSRNFGSFAAVRSGLAAAHGRYFAVKAADLQEPGDLMLDFFHALESESVDVVIGTRTGRDDPLPSHLAARLFWALYRRLIQREMPPGGVDAFGCNKVFRDQILALKESNTSLVGLLFWLGFRRKLIPYRRRARRHGRSAWSWARKLRYFFDSVFAFSDLPIRLLIGCGAVSMVVSALLAALVLAARLSGLITVPGYAGIVLAIAFFAGFNTLGLGIIGAYVWRAFENTKSRPDAVVMSRVRFEGKRGPPSSSRGTRDQSPQ